MCCVPGHGSTRASRNREKASQEVLAEARNTFGKKPEHFRAHHSVYEPFDENSLDGTEETVEMDDTVPSKLRYALGIFGKALDVTATKEVTNQSPEARAPVVIDDEVILEPLPATALLMLENKLKGLQQVFHQIPTLAPGRDWKLDPEKGSDIYRDQNPEVKFRSQKVLQHKVVAEPTKEHPAQVEKWAEDVNVGKTTKTVWCGMITPADKSELLARLQVLIGAVKQARMRANCAEVVHTSVAKPIIDFLLPRSQ